MDLSKICGSVFSVKLQAFNLNMTTLKPFYRGHLKVAKCLLSVFLSKFRFSLNLSRSSVTFLNSKVKVTVKCTQINKKNDAVGPLRAFFVNLGYNSTFALELPLFTLETLLLSG